MGGLAMTPLDYISIPSDQLMYFQVITLAPLTRTVVLTLLMRPKDKISALFTLVSENPQQMATITLIPRTLWAWSRR
jgi:hypothetical protein